MFLILPLSFAPSPSPCTSFPSSKSDSGASCKEGRSALTQHSTLNTQHFPYFPALAYADADYVLGPEDEISIIVWDHPDLTRRTRINLEGTISFPLIGELQVAGISQLQLEKKLRGMLADGYIIDPQVSVQVTDYRSQKIFVIGEVNSPGSYPLTRKTLLVEAMAMAGGVKQEADHEIMIVRPKKNHTSQTPLLPDQADPSELIKVRLRDVLEGENSQNIEVCNLDTIFIPRIKVFYVTGEVKRPGQYTFMKGMSLLQAVSTAGGFTEKAARKKVKITREKDGKKVELVIPLENPIEPGDTVVVPESFW
jgi:polysaccharide biosynthesis/export protein